MAVEVDQELLIAVKGILADHHKEIGAKYVTQEQSNTSYANAEKKMTELLAAAEAKAKAELEAKLKDMSAENQRLINQRTARPPAALVGTGGDLDVRSLGQRFVESDQYKSWSSGDQHSRTKLQLAVKGRIRQPLEVRANTITEPGSGWPFLPQRVGIFDQPTLPLVMRDLLTVVQLSGTNAVEYVLETWNYAADYQVLEGDKKAQGDVTYTEKTAMVRTIAWFIKTSRQMLADAPYFASTIDSQLLYGVAKKEDHELLWGDGAAGHLLGIMPQATPLPADVLPDMTYAADTIAAAIAHLASIGYVPTAVVMNPLDWASMQISKTTQGMYILGGPPAGNAARTLWTLPIVNTSEMPRGQFLVGAFPPNATLFDREAASVDVAYENEDDFVRNLVTIRCEERIALAVYRPQAFVKGAITFAAPALATAHARERK